MAPQRADDQKSSNVPATIDALAGLWGLTDAELGEAGGVSRVTAQNRRRPGAALPRSDEMRGYADFFGLPIELFYMDPGDAVVAAVTEFAFLERKPVKRRYLRSVGDDGEYAPRDSNPEPNDSGSVGQLSVRAAA